MVEKYYKINSSKFWNDVCSMKKDGFEIIKIFLNESPAKSKFFRAGTGERAL